MNLNNDRQPSKWRLNRALAHLGVASRRAVEQLITAGRVRVNGKVVRDPAYRCDPWSDRFEVDGRRLKRPQQLAVVMLNKPKGYVTTRRDPQGRRTVFDLLRTAPSGLHPVGRLDTVSRGLLLLTNDGDLTELLTHPRHEVAKTYRILVAGNPDQSVLDQLRWGIDLADGRTAPANVAVVQRKGTESILQIEIREGRYRQIRRMLAAVGHPLVDLERTGIGPLRLGTLPSGKWRYLTAAERSALLNAAKG